jgi:two-component system, NarL family, nitrate/nitrite response regulator NarL
MKKSKLSAYRLTPRESEIAPLLSRGTPQKEIADTLKISPHTLAVHLKHLRQKFNVRTCAEATGFLARFFI